MTAPRSLRARLVWLFAGGAGLLLIIAAAAMSVLVGRAVWGPLDASLREEAETLDSLRTIDLPEEFDHAVTLVGGERDLGREKFVFVTGHDGEAVAAAGSVGVHVRIAPPRPAREIQRALLSSRGHSYRAVWFPHSGGGWIELGVNADDQVHALRRARAVIAASAGTLFAIFAVLAWTITTHATTELERLTAELETVEAGALDRRVVPRQTLEVDRLAAVLNRLLGRLETAVSHLRRFTADAAHELRTPVAALRAGLEVTLGRPRSAEGYRDALLDALEQTERLERLAEDLLALSVIEAGGVSTPLPAEPVRLDLLVREVEEFLEPVAQEQGRRFRCRSAGPVAVRGTPALLKRVLLNLVDNAFRHTPHLAAVELAVGAHDGLACIEVADEGPGIPPDELPLVFERFHRGRTDHAGSGLGLALCREIVTRHKGQITVDSSPSTGTTVTVTLPLERPASDAA